MRAKRTKRIGKLEHEQTINGRYIAGIELEASSRSSKEGWVTAVYSARQAFEASAGAEKKFAGNNEGHRGGTWLGGERGCRKWLSWLPFLEQGAELIHLTKGGHQKRCAEGNAKCSPAHWLEAQ